MSKYIGQKVMDQLGEQVWKVSNQVSANLSNQMFIIIYKVRTQVCGQLWDTTRRKFR